MTSFFRSLARFGAVLGSAFVLSLLWASMAFAATYTVNSTNDANDGTCDGTHCSLREAMLAANGNVGADTIDFSVSGTISPGSLLPVLTDSAGVTISGGGNITLDGADTIGNGIELHPDSSTNVIKGLTFKRFSNNAILMEGSNSTLGGTAAGERNVLIDGSAGSNTLVMVNGSGMTIINNYLGVESDGSTVNGAPNGIGIGASASSLTIGGDASNERNIISGNSTCGINFAFAPSGSVTIIGNYIGTTSTGGAAAANGNGICTNSSLTFGAAITIGTTTAGEANLISGNTTDGINLMGTFNANTNVSGNIIGLNRDSNAALANGGDGVDLNRAACSASVTCRMSSNTIAGNTGNGVNIRSTSSRFSLINNKIGNDGTTAYANNIGITIASSSTITVGSTDGTYDTPNIISGNTSHGISISDSTTSSITITENVIGLNSAVNGTLANGGDGVNINGSGTVTFGSASSSAILNHISGNTGDGIDITSNVGAIAIYNSTIGVNNATDYGNGGDGIVVSGSPTAAVTIGNSRGADGGTGGNVISGNAGYGIKISAGNSHVIKGNNIGTNQNANGAVANDVGGITVTGGSSTTIGGTGTVEGNVIAGHGGASDADVTIGSSASGVNIYGNYVGMNSSGTVIQSSIGLYVQGSSTTIGSATGTGRNYMGGHNQVGGASLWFNNASTATVVANHIGLRPDNTATTHEAGVLVSGSSSNVTIGATGSSTDYNVLGGASNACLIVGAGSTVTNLVVKGTLIGTTPDETGDRGCTGDAIVIQSGDGIYLGRDVAGSSYAENVLAKSGNGVDLPAGGTATNVFIAKNMIGVARSGASYGALGNDSNGIIIESGSNITIGGTGTNDGNVIGSNTAVGISISGVDSIAIRRNYIGTTPALAARANLMGIVMENDTDNTVIGYAFSDTPSLGSSGYANRIGFNTSGDINVDGSTSTGNSIRGNIFDLSASDTSTNISLTNSGNNGVSLSGTSLTTKNTSRVGGTTNFAASSKVDVYSITSAYATTYEGTSTVSSGAFQLDMDFAATSSDQYYYQIAESDGDTTALSSKVTVDADSTAPSAPTITSTTTLTTTAAYTLAGTKDAYSSIVRSNSAIVAVDSATTWTYAATLTEGSNSFVLTSKDYSANESSAASTFSVTLDTVAPTAPTLTSSNEIQSYDATYATTLTGTKDANTNVRNNGTQIIGRDASTTWSYGVTLSQGVNNFVFTSADEAGNVSSNREVSVRLSLPQGGGGGGGSGGSSGGTSGTSGSSGDSGKVNDDSKSSGGESEVKQDGGTSGSVSGEQEKLEVKEVIKPVEESKPAPAPTPAPAPVAPAPKPVVVQPAPAPVIVAEIKDLYPAEDEKVEESEAASEEESEVSSPAVVSYDIATYVEVPVTTVTRTAILENADYQKITPVDDAGIPVWIQEKFNKEKKEEKVITKDSDLDGDGILDAAEILLGTKLDRKDSDGDGINDDKEIAQGTNPTMWDTDGDGISDRDEARRGTNPNDSDSDNDGVSDAEEISAGSDPKDGKDKPRVNEQGVPEEWANKYRDLKDVKYGEPQKIQGIEKEIKLTFAMTDTDGDGLSDQAEYKLGTNPTRGDTDRDGVLDGAEVHDYQTDPTRDTKTESFYSAKASNLKSGANTFAGTPVMRGTAQPNSTVEVIFLPKQQESPTAWMLFASLFGVESNGAVTQKFKTDATGKFLARPEVKDGDYMVVVRSLDANGAITEESLPYEVKVDSSLAEKVVTPRQLDTEAIDVENLQLITINNNRPYLYGTAKKGYEVVTSWKSQLYTSSLLVDTDEGEFVTLAPADLESGDHDLYVYAVEPVKNLSTSLISIDFNVLGAMLYGAANDVAEGGAASILTNWKLWVGLGVPLLLVLILIFRKKKPTPTVSS